MADETAGLQVCLNYRLDCEDIDLASGIAYTDFIKTTEARLRDAGTWLGMRSSSSERLADDAGKDANDASEAPVAKST